MTKFYKIREGFSFVCGGITKLGGELIELADDLFGAHQHKLEPAEKEPAAEVKLTPPALAVVVEKPAEPPAEKVEETPPAPTGETEMKQTDSAVS